MELQESKSSYGSDGESKPEMEQKKSSFMIESSKSGGKKSAGISIKKSHISEALVEIVSDVFVLMGAIALAAYLFAKTAETSIPIEVWILLMFAIGFGFKLYARNKKG